MECQKTNELKITSLEQLGILKKEKIKGNKPSEWFTVPCGAINYTGKRRSRKAAR
jgi:hypothetical protein